jgi:hypothetical protein
MTEHPFDRERAYWRRLDIIADRLAKLAVASRDPVISMALVKLALAATAPLPAPPVAARRCGCGNELPPYDGVGRPRLHCYDCRAPRTKAGAKVPGSRSMIA